MRIFKALAAFAVLFLTVTHIVVGSSQSASAAESISYDFNTPGTLASTFNEYVSAGTVSQSVSGGINNSGAIQVDPNVTTNAVYATKDGYSLGPVGSTYTFTSQMRSFANNGYSGMGFTSLNPSAANASGTPFRPNDALGISVHGGGYVFHNGGTNANGSWGSSYSGANNLWTISTGGGITTNCDDSTQNDCWFKVVFKITRTTTTEFTARVELYGSSQSGTLDSQTAIAIVEFRNQTNSTLTQASLLYSYINFSGQRMKYFDDFQVNLAGGASVISAGAPVVLTSSAQESTGTFTLGGNVTADGGAAVSERGFVYSTSTNPVLSDNKVTSGSGTGTFSSVVNSIPSGTYYVRAYATNTTGTSYGAEQILNVAAVNTVTFHANGGSGTLANQSSSTAVALSANVFTRTAYIFQGWATSQPNASAGTVAYADGASFPFSASQTLYAVWSPDPSYKTVVFDANGGTGSVSSQSSNSATGLTSNTFIRNGYTFAGWATSQLRASVGTVDYVDSSSYPFASSGTLYAVWTAAAINSTPSSGNNVPTATSASLLANTGAAAIPRFAMLGITSAFLGISIFAGSVAVRRRRQ